MVAQAFGEFSVELTPDYHLIQQLPADGNVFAASLLTTTTLLHQISLALFRLLASLVST
jgi:hypothetical protein